MGIQCDAFSVVLSFFYGKQTLSFVGRGLRLVASSLPLIPVVALLCFMSFQDSGSTVYFPVADALASALP